jgi:hypothetical protein
VLVNPVNVCLKSEVRSGEIWNSIKSNAAALAESASTNTEAAINLGRGNLTRIAPAPLANRRIAAALHPYW